jgi:hypothetical protein
MQSSGFSHRSFSAPWDGDPIRAAEEDIRRYLIRHGVLTPPAPVAPPSNARTMLCFLAIYVAIGLAVLLGLFCLMRLECDPLFSDRGLKAVCRNRTGNLTKTVGPASDTYSGFMPSSMPQ